MAGLVIFFVPMFGEMFDDVAAAGRIAGPDRLAAWLSATTLAAATVGLVLVAVAIGVILLRRELDTEEGKRWRDYFKLRLPLLGPIFTSLAVARFCRVLGTLLHNGVPILKSLEISRDAAGNRILSEAIGKASENISSGQSLATPLGRCEHFPPTVVEMISVAEESNTLDSGAGRHRRWPGTPHCPPAGPGRAIAGTDHAAGPGRRRACVVVIALLMPVIKMSSTMRA